MKMMDTHCHLDYLKKHTIDEILQKSNEAGIEKIITIAVNIDNLERVLEISSAHENVYATLGVHPHYAANNWDKSHKIIVENLNHPSLVAIGEIGLDYHYNRSPADIQKSVFEKQLQIAVDHNLPVVIHSREADDDTIDILKNHINHLKGNCVLHSFTSGKTLADFAIRNGFYLGVNGIITFNAAENVRNVLRDVPLRNLLLETDAPFLAPIPHRGHENSPVFLKHIAKKLAEIKEVSLEEICKQTSKNALTLFRL